MRYSVIDSAQINNRKAGLTVYETRDTEYCPLSVLTGRVCTLIEGSILEKIYELFVGTNETVRYIRVLERGSSAVLQGERKENHEEHILIPKHIAILSPEKKIKES